MDPRNGAAQIKVVLLRRILEDQGAVVVHLHVRLLVRGHDKFNGIAWVDQHGGRRRQELGNQPRVGRIYVVVDIITIRVAPYNRAARVAEYEGHLLHDHTRAKAVEGRHMVLHLVQVVAQVCHQHRGICRAPVSLHVLPICG